ncbi:MAG: LrgB family protein [Candidatus Adiutrix sp.]|jgi:predicted murein hydrolase (TIGR00659 family)|nr:LrgB family protein [Candidatus Adiutrix sp.]
MQHLTTAFFIVLTAVVYNLVRRLSMRHHNHPLLNIVGLSVATLIGVLLIGDIPYSAYEPASDIITFMLGPATVGLALPLYRYRAVLKRRATALIGTVALGSLAAMVIAALIAHFGGLPREVNISILTKGISVPFALEISEMYGGIPPLAAAFVVATGTLGAIFGGWLLTRFKVGDPVARGLAFGTVSHGQGTAAALIEGEQQGAMAGLAMILAGILTTAMAPAVVFFLDLL